MASASPKTASSTRCRCAGYAGMDIGRDDGLPVSPGKTYYLRRPFPFQGTIRKVGFVLE